MTEGIAMGTRELASPPSDPGSWQQALYAFLPEKERRLGSRRTVESYSRILQDFFGRTGKKPDEVTAPEVHSWAHGIGCRGGGRLRCPSVQGSPASRRSTGS